MWESTEYLSTKKKWRDIERSRIRAIFKMAYRNAHEAQPKFIEAAWGVILPIIGCGLLLGLAILFNGCEPTKIYAAEFSDDKKWAEFPFYPKKMYITCQLYQSSHGWWDTQCQYHRNGFKVGEILFQKNIITAFSKNDGVNADGRLFDPTMFLNNPKQKYSCKKNELFFHYFCIEIEERKG